MGYVVYQGHRLEALVKDHLVEFQAGFWGPRPAIVLQNQSLAQWLKLFLARTLGGYATGDFLFQDEVLRRLLEAHGADQRLLFLDDLKFALYRRLAGLLVPGGDPLFAPLIGAGGPPDPARLFELADHIAGVFHNYGMNSALWPSALGSGVLPPGSAADPGAFAWESSLWRALLTGGEGTLAGLAMDELTRVPPEPRGDVVRVVLVGSAFLSRRAAGFLRAWADAGLVDVVHLLLVPAPGSWPSRRPWSSWGAFGQAFLALIPEPTTSSLPSEPGPSALSRLQHALLTGQGFPGGPPDGSLVVVSAPHPLRELEELRDRLLAALADDPSLEVNDIAVLAPDINVYAPFLDAAWGSDDPGRNLRHHVIDLDLGRENAWFRALDAVLALISGTVDRPHLFALVDTPAFREAWGVDDPERDLWLDYTEEISAWREDGDQDSGPQTWSAGADRLYAGWFRVDGEVPPLDTAPSAFRSLGRLQHLLEALRTAARDARRPRSLDEWVRFLDQTVGTFLAAGDGTGAVLSGRLRTLAHDAGSPEDKLPWAGFRAFVQDQIAHFPGRRGQLLTEGIHCSSLRPLRAIPFRVIAILGLDEGRFPRQAPLPSFDLRRFEPSQEASSALALDRYCFWETLMAAQSALFLSYQGRSPVDGSERPPSTVLADLLDFLEVEGACWPVAQASVKDFSLGPGSPATGSPRTLRRAEALAQGLTATPLAPHEEPQDLADLFPEVKTSEVVQAFTVPARFHLQRVRQVVLRDEDRRGVDEEEPWSLGFLDRETWLHDQLRRHLEGQTNLWDVEGFLARSLATGTVREGVFTDRDRKDLGFRAAQASAWADELRTEGWRALAGFAPRTRWAGRPWTPEGEPLVRGGAVLIPRLLYSQKIPIRSKVEAAIQGLLARGSTPVLATLNPEGERRTATWALDEAQTIDLGTQAQAYWVEATTAPLPFYPDFLEALAKRRTGDEPWEVSVEEAWGQAWKAGDQGRARSSALLARDPYAALAFAEDPDWKALALGAQRWWDGLFVPLLGAWE